VSATGKNLEMSSDSHITFFARINYREDQRVFGIRQADRRAHLYIIGKTGTGKSTLLSTLIRQDVESGQGLALLDPHGDLVEKVLSALPESRKRDCIYCENRASFSICCSRVEIPAFISAGHDSGSEQVTV